MNPPDAPDPKQTAAAQTAMNKDTAITQAGLNMTNQNTPQGSLTYKQIGTWDDGTPRYEANQSLSPENQKLWDNYTQLAGKFGDIGNAQANTVAGALGTPFSFEASQAKKMDDIKNTFLNPQWDRQGSALETQLHNQGVNPGTEAYERAMSDFSTNRQHAYDQSFLDSYNTTANQALTERNQPLNEMTAMLSGSQVQQPNMVNTPNTPVSGVDYAGLVGQKYAADQSAYNAKLGGAFGLAGTALGGWARGGFPTSDRRMKRDIKRVGTLDNGLPVYNFRYITDPDTVYMGLMADEVEGLHPDAVVEIGGIKTVNYQLAVQ